MPASCGPGFVLLALAHNAYAGVSMSACCGGSGLLYGRPEAVLAQEDMKRVLKELLHALSSDSTNTTLAEAGVAAGALAVQFVQQNTLLALCQCSHYPILTFMVLALFKGPSIS